MRLTLAGLAAGFAMTGGVAFADSISPDSYTATLDVGESVTITKTVTVSAGRPTSSLVDVFFLSDTTGSMGGTINTVRTQASSIMSGLSSYGSVQFGVGEYKDVYQPGKSWGSPGDYPWKLNQAVTSSTAAVQAGINQWSASGGNDGPEANLIALQTVATDASVGWRDGARKFVVWFGDIQGHDPSVDDPSYPGPTLNATLASLVDSGITVIAVGSGLNGGGTNQATVITAGTGGTFYASTTAGTIVDQIDDAIAAAFASYSTVGLQVNGVPGVTVTTSPAYVGSWTREEERTFTFDVTFTGAISGVHDFTIDAVIDGAVAATETDHITVRGPREPGVVPVPAALPLLLSALAAGGVIARRRRH